MASVSVRCLLGWLGVVWFGAGPALADGILRDSYGARSSGRAGASIAVPDSGSVIADNPGALHGLPSSQLFELRIDSYLLDTKYADPENSAGGPFRPALIPELTWASKGDRWAFGFSLISPGGFSTRYSLAAPSIGETPYQSSLTLLKALPAVSYRIDERWSIGATLGAAYAGLSLKAPLFTQTGAFSGLPTTQELDAHGWGIASSAGVYYVDGTAGDRVSLGLIYTHGTHFSLEGETTARFFGLTPDPLAAKFDAKLELDLPRSVGVGVAREWNRTRLSLDVVWTDWASAFDDVPLRLDGSADAGFAGQVLRDRFPLEWNDRVSLRIGVERMLSGGRVLSAGYNYHPNPVRRRTLTPLIPTVLEHTVALGFAVPMGRFTLAFATQFSAGPSTRIGRSRIVGGEFDGGKLDGYAFGLFVGVTYAID
jgi:long-chain fatty acid transport protein